MRDEKCRPFPDEVRAGIYEHFIDLIRQRDADVPVSLSTESPGVWRRLGAKLGCGPGDYVCGCGPQCTPGKRRLDENPFTINSAGPQGGFEAL